ncbi:MAG TPA: hypothetical protein VGB25_01070 [Candidatus Binatia bacterium]
MANWKARVGILSPSVFEIPSDWSATLPPGISLAASGLNVRAHTPEEFEKAVGDLESALQVFLAEEVDAILVGGITLATQRGFQAEQNILSDLSIRLRLPLTTGMQASVEALRHFEAKRIVIATAYKESINGAVRKYFEEAGFEVAGIRGLGVSRPVEQAKLQRDASAKVARTLIQAHPDADAILLQGRWPSVGSVQRLETELKLPVVATVAASLWWALRRLRLDIPVRGFGRLLQGASS